MQPATVMPLRDGSGFVLVLGDPDCWKDLAHPGHPPGHILRVEGFGLNLPRNPFSGFSTLNPSCGNEKR